MDPICIAEFLGYTGVLLGKVVSMSAKAVVDFKPDKNGAQDDTEICTEYGIHPEAIFREDSGMGDGCRPILCFVRSISELQVVKLLLHRK